MVLDLCVIGPVTTKVVIKLEVNPEGIKKNTLPQKVKYMEDRPAPHPLLFVPLCIHKS